MTKPLLDLRGAPVDPVERAVWLGGVMAAVRRELDDAYSETYAEARLTGRWSAILQAGPLSRTKALALTRRYNERHGRGIRWGDGN